MSDYESYSYEDLADALTKIREQINADDYPLVWTGPDRLHFSILATNFPPSWQFSLEGLEYSAEHGRDVWEVYTHVAFMLGFHQGAIRQEEHTDFWKMQFLEAQAQLSKLTTLE